MADVKMEEEEEQRTNGEAPRGEAAAAEEPTKPSLLLGGEDEEEEPEEEEEEEADRRRRGETAIPHAGPSIRATGTTDGTLPLAVDAAAAAPSERDARGGYDDRLLSPIVTPSPFHHHNSSARYSSALARVQSDPLRDIEAWQAVLTEAQASFRQIRPFLGALAPAGGGPAAPPPGFEDLGRKVDWVESCYGALLEVFPYSGSHAAQAGEVLWATSGLGGEEEEDVGFGPPSPAGGGAAGGGGGFSVDRFGGGIAVRQSPGEMTERQKRSERKLERLLAEALGVNMDGTDYRPAGAAAAGGEGGRGGGTEPAPADGPADPSDSGAGGAGGTGGTGRTEEEEAAAAPAAAAAAGPHLVGGLLTSSVELWTLYVRKAARDARRRAIHSMPGSDEAGRAEHVRNRVAAAYDTALARGGAHARDCHVLWRACLAHAKGWIPPPGGGGDAAAEDAAADARRHGLRGLQRARLRTVYQSLVAHPMTGLDQLWTEYEAFERGQSEALAAALLAEHLPKYQHARSVYLERGRAYNVHELRAGRLATPPVDAGRYRVSPGAGAAVGAGGAGGGPGGAAGAAAATAAAAGEGGGPGGEGRSPSEYAAAMAEECAVLAKWRRRCGYERTNPERLGAAELGRRVRGAYKDAACAFMRHPEVWHEWAMWELLHSSSASGAAGSSGSGSGSSDGAKSGTGTGDKKSKGALAALSVLRLARVHIPDSALLAQAHASIVESHGCGSGSGSGVGLPSRPGSAGGGEGSGPGAGSSSSPGSDAVSVLEDFCSRSGTTLGYVLWERLARRHRGAGAARAVFARARRCLRVRPEDGPSAASKEAGVGGAGEAAGAEKGVAVAEATGGAGEGAGGVGVGVGVVEDEKKENGEDAEKAAAAAAGAASMVTSRVGTASSAANSGGAAASASAGAPPPPSSAGYITWHLYASHAQVEHRLNRRPRVAARVYELGLRRHRTFLSSPPYVLRYANLLLELGDEENLRALLTRAVAACEEDGAAGGGGGGVGVGVGGRGADDAEGGGAGGAGEGGAGAAGAAEEEGSGESRRRLRREAQRPLWDLLLRFESALCAEGGGGDPSAVRRIEARRRRALYGPGGEEVAGGERPGRRGRPRRGRQGGGGRGVGEGGIE